MQSHGGVGADTGTHALEQQLYRPRRRCKQTLHAGCSMLINFLCFSVPRPYRKPCSLPKRLLLDIQPAALAIHVSPEDRLGCTTQQSSIIQQWRQYLAGRCQLCDACHSAPTTLRYYVLALLHCSPSQFYFCSLFSFRFIFFQSDFHWKFAPNTQLFHPRTCHAVADPTTWRPARQTQAPLIRFIQRTALSTRPRVHHIVTAVGERRWRIDRGVD